MWERENRWGTEIGGDFRMYLFCPDVSPGPNSKSLVPIVSAHGGCLFYPSFLSSQTTLSFGSSTKELCFPSRERWCKRPAFSWMWLLGWELFVFSNGMCLYCSLEDTVSANLASILTSSFLRNSKRAGTQAVSGRGGGKQRVVQNREE